ncbi:MAG: hypothetical protein RLZZ444_4256, partial [Pseudomonadota bacterium]
IIVAAHPRPIRARKLGATLQPRKVGTEQRLQTFRMAIPIDQFWSTAAGFP